MRDISYQPETEYHAQGQPVTIAGIDIPFMDMVAFMVKWAIAAIPAACILFVLGLALFTALGIGGRVLH